MYESYTRQSLPTKQYRELLGSAICVFNSNNAFIIENILRCDDLNKYDWYHLIDLESGHLKESVHEIITSKCGDKIETLFAKIIKMRNRIIHSYHITNASDEQTLATKERAKNGNKQFEITEKYLLNFIALNQELSDLLHNLRGY
ncbi:selenium binding protein [Allofournierella sp. CML151]|uniref:selenium binding protein n=1 Tax=Allofournierella sp. CML151 TaxID=2998082 RepID=UPI0022EB5573|nr:selenium binding protein [Fournierella sp. CML151]